MNIKKVSRRHSRSAVEILLGGQRDSIQVSRTTWNSSTDDHLNNSGVMQQCDGDTSVHLVPVCVRFGRVTHRLYEKQIGQLHSHSHHRVIIQNLTIEHEEPCTANWSCTDITPAVTVTPGRQSWASCPPAIPYSSPHWNVFQRARMEVRLTDRHDVDRRSKVSPSLERQPVLLAVLSSDSSSISRVWSHLNHPSHPNIPSSLFHS